MPKTLRLEIVMDLSAKRKSGILLHPTALPGSYGIGEIGPQAYRFVDHLSDMGQGLWQILPIGPTDFHNSPYSSISTFAGNHLLISLDLLEEEGLLDSKYLGNYFKNDYLFFYKFLTTEWENVYKKTVLKKKL